MPVVDRQVGNGLQCTEIRLLALRLGGITGPTAHASGEVANPIDLVPGQQELSQSAKVQPTIRRVPQRAVVEVEAVNVDVGADDSHPRNG